MTTRRLLGLGLVLTAFLPALAGCSGDSSSHAAEGDDQNFTEAPTLFPSPQGRVATLPIVLAHGFDASTTNRWSFNGVEAALRARGFKVHSALVHPYRSSEDRAVDLQQHVLATLAEFHATKVHIIAHSMGGLDTRFLVSPGGLNLGDKVASVTTISTPHHGSAFADVALKLVPGGQPEQALNAVAGLWARSFTSADLSDADLRGALTSISVTDTKRFNAKVVNHPRVRYQSWAGVSSVGLFGRALPGPHDSTACEGAFVHPDGRSNATDGSLLAGQALLVDGEKLLPNDGMVTVESAKWGEFQGCIPADHLGEVGQPNHGKSAWTGFDHKTFYLTVGFSLARLE